MYRIKPENKRILKTGGKTYLFGGNSQVCDGSLILQVETRGKSSELAASFYVLISLKMISKRNTFEIPR